MISYRNVTKDDLKIVSKLYTQSFKEYCFFKSTIGKIFKSEKEYLHFLETLFFINTNAFVKKQICIVGVLDGKIVSAATLNDPDKPQIGFLDYICSGGIKLFKETSILNILKFMKFLNSAKKACESLKTNVWYFDSLAVDKAYQGKGFGSKMINECVIPYITSKNGNEVVFITNSEINRKFYTKNGFKEFDSTTISFKNNTINNWSYCMML